MTSSHRFLVSDELFDMATQAIRAHSIETRKFESIVSTATAAARQVQQHPVTKEKIAQLLDTTPIDGPNRIHIELRGDGKPAFKSAGDELAAAYGAGLTAKQRFALMLMLALEMGRSGERY